MLRAIRTSVLLPCQLKKTKKISLKSAAARDFIKTNTLKIAQKTAPPAGGGWSVVWGRRRVWA